MEHRLDTVDPASLAPPYRVLFEGLRAENAALTERNRELERREPEAVVEGQLLALALLLVALPRVFKRAQLLIPIYLQGAGHQSIVRVDSQVPAPGQLGLVLRALDRLVAKLVGALELRLELLL